MSLQLTLQRLFRLNNLPGSSDHRRRDETYFLQFELVAPQNIIVRAYFKSKVDVDFCLSGL